MKKYAYLAVAAICLAATGAQAQQFSAQADIATVDGGATVGSSYTGPGSNTSIINIPVGSVLDGGSDAFDIYGFYSNFGTLTFTRQTELLSDNTYRFFDTFTNAASRSTVVQSVVFTGDLGSDSATQVLTSTPGLRVTCQGVSGNCGGDPVVASVYSNNGSGLVSYTPGFQGSGDRYNVTFNLSVAPGQSVSLLNYAFLAQNINGTDNADLALANVRGLALQAAPNVTGLTQQQLATVQNFNLGVTPAVPEPAIWAMMIGGFGIVGGAMRRRSAKPSFATA